MHSFGEYKLQLIVLRTCVLGILLQKSDIIVNEVVVDCSLCKLDNILLFSFKFIIKLE